MHRKVLAAALATIAFATTARAQDPAPVAFEQEAFACVQLVLARGKGAELDLAQLQQPSYRVGARLSGQSCADTRMVELPADQVAPVLKALRALGRQAEEPGPLRDAVDRCEGSGPGVGFGEAPPVFGPGQLTLELEACGSTLVASAVPAPDASAQDLPAVSVTAVPGAADIPPPGPEPTQHVRRWRPDSGRIDVAASREKNDDGYDDEFKLRVDTLWVRGPNETRLELEVDNERDFGENWDREANGRLGRFHQFENGWFRMYEGFMERNQVLINTTDEDYLLLQASFGGGYRWHWDERASLRAAVLWNYFYFDLLDLDESANLDAPSAYFSGEWSITPRIKARATVRVYDWPNGDTGTELDSDIAYDLTKYLGFGLRWRYSRDGASLDRDDEDKIEMFLRYRF